MCADMRVYGSHPDPEGLTPRVLWPLWNRTMAAARRKLVSEMMAHRVAQHAEKKDQIEKAIKEVLGDQSAFGAKAAQKPQQLRGGWADPALSDLHREMVKTKRMIDQGMAPPAPPMGRAEALRLIWQKHAEAQPPSGPPSP